MRSILLAVALAAVSAFAQSPQKVDPAKSTLRFVSKQMGVAVDGAFRKFDGTIAFDPAKPEATKADIEVELGSIDLGGDEAETEVKRAAWFDTARFPKGRFVLSSLKATTQGKYEAAGTLTIKGTSQPVVAPVTLIESAAQRTLEGQFTVKRLQFRIGDGPWSDPETVADEVLVRFRFVIPR